MCMGRNGQVVERVCCAVTQAGQILLDDVNLGYIDHSFLHEQVSIVAQVKPQILPYSLGACTVFALGSGPVRRLKKKTSGLKYTNFPGEGIILANVR